VRRGVVVRALFRQRWFGSLYTTRIVGQLADGVFQASLASAVFFNPEHRTDPRQAAAGFVLLLLPYSLVGPFAGVLLDRWRRQRVLVRANLVRAVLVLVTAELRRARGPRTAAFAVAALAALSVNRFYLAALSASLPHVVRREQLVLANAVTTTSGSAVSAIGVGIGLAVHGLAGSGDRGNAVVAVLAAAAYGASAVVASRMPARLLGPADVSADPVLDELRHVLRGLMAGAVHVHRRPAARRALAAVSGSRLLFGLSTIGTLLLYRNYFIDDGVLRSGAVGLGQVVAVATSGYLLAAFVTPGAVRRVGKTAWMVALLALAALAQLAGGLPFAPGPLVAGAGVIGFASAGVKICVDTVVQEQVDDEFRGRVFSFYDTLFNVTFVVAAVVAAFALPRTGRSPAMVIVMSCGYAVTAIAFALAERRAGGSGVSAATPATAKA
jgi:MFS family permease